ncbi:hypothetical protein V5O48_006796 [Marasmius crinis-equi]|uniref:Uncharacterized protein n=1 Tax=Marasmius crinis-equi TaxID=585013 RepID=A0ABR3FIW0_9AGAR
MAPTTPTTPTVTPSAISNASLSKPPKDVVPLGAIVGGVAGGVLLAIIALAAWKIWRRSMKRKRAKEENVCITRRNTLRNRNTSTTSKLRSYSPLVWAPPATKVKWAATEKDVKDTPMSSDDQMTEKTKAEEKPRPGLIMSTLKSKEKDGEASGGSSPTTPSRPKPLKSSRSAGRSAMRQGSRRPPDLAGDVKLPVPPPPTSPPLRAPRHRPSTISSGSYYSLESGEEHPVPRPPRLQSVLSAMGNLSEARISASNGNRLSVSSSMWSFFSRNSRVMRGGGSSRFSQATSNSAYSQPEEPPVGVAY